MRILREPPVYGLPSHLYKIVRTAWGHVAEQVVGLIDSERFCPLCRELIAMTGKTICEECALNTLPKKCRTCHKWTGLYLDLEEDADVEHRACKRRRLNNAL